MTRGQAVERPRAEPSASCGYVALRRKMSGDFAKPQVSITHATHSLARPAHIPRHPICEGDTVARARQSNSPLSSECKSSNLSRTHQASRMACVISRQRHPTRFVHRPKQNLSGVDPTHACPPMSTIVTKSGCARRQCATILLKVKFNKSCKRIARKFRVHFVHNVI
jgi:hypothetical protein